MAVWLACLTAALLLYIAQLVAIVVLEHRRQALMTAWLFIALVCPYLGFIAYWMIGRAPLRRHRGFKSYGQEPFRYADRMAETVADERDAGNKQLEEQAKLYAMLSKLAPFPITKRNKTLVLTNGEDTFSTILKALEQASHHIHLQFYTIRHDATGQKFLDVLTRQARKGVEVRVLYDGVGSLQLNKRYVEALHAAGVRTGCFSPPRSALAKRRLNQRNHRKVVVIDGRIGFLGGINIGDEYIGKDPKLGFWRDTHLRLEGDSVYYLQELFMDDWELTVNESLERLRYMLPHSCDGKERVLIVPGRPGYEDPNIMEILFAAITGAKSTVYAATPYFIPDPSIAASLRMAARSGVDVRLIIPDMGDSKLVLLATLSYVQEMLDAGVRIFRYRKGFIHAKVLLIDQMLACVGTANLDMRSLYSNYELNALLFDIAAIRRLERDFMEDLRQSYEVDAAGFRNRPRKQKTYESITHILSPLL